VHAFPNAKLNASLPVQLSKIATLPLDVSWTYAKGNTAAKAGATVTSDLVDASLNANVAVDMFNNTSRLDRRRQGNP